MLKRWINWLFSWFKAPIVAKPEPQLDKKFFGELEQQSKELDEKMKAKTEFVDAKPRPETTPRRSEPVYRDTTARYSAPYSSSPPVHQDNTIQNMLIGGLVVNALTSDDYHYRPDSNQRVMEVTPPKVEQESTPDRSGGSDYSSGSSGYDSGSSSSSYDSGSGSFDSGGSSFDSGGSSW